MKATEQYLKRLVELADEIHRFHWPTIGDEQLVRAKEVQYAGLIDHLVGYILALKDL